jgi:hypothetical protein
MKRIFAAGLFALAALLAVDTTASAQAPGCPPGIAATLPRYSQTCQAFGCAGFCFRFLSKITQEGPLFNYGPYCGYYPFEPYGPWNSALQYVGPYPQPPGCGWCGLCGKFHGHGGCGKHGCGGLGCGKHGCSTCGGWGHYAATTFRNVHFRLFPFSHKCKNCATALGDSPAAPVVASAASNDNAVQQTSYPRRER